MKEKISTRDALVEYGDGHIHVRLTGNRGAANQARRLIEQIDIHPIDLGFAREAVRVWNDFGEGQAIRTFAGTHVSVGRM